MVLVDLGISEWKELCGTKHVLIRDVHYAWNSDLDTGTCARSRFSHHRSFPDCSSLARASQPSGIEMTSASLKMTITDRDRYHRY
jgi:hypothetical protein